MYVIRSLTGPLEGRKFLISESLKLGRRQGDIALNDPAASDPHAEIKLNSKGHLFLTDLNSKNGVFVNGKKQSKVLLKKNSKFTIGKSEFQVVFLEMPEEIWKEILKDNVLRVSDRPKDMSFFPCSLGVEFLSGPQKGARFTLTYGPRYFGSFSVDVPLLDSKAPPEAFVLSPGKWQTIFKTDFPETVQLNGRQTRQIAIKDNDTVFIGETEIKITFLV
ncbi:MAG: FHA domain-containing protein [Bdellovibrionales bacterium]|nr:FHA domain-containing protein [Bdellovibrionales bacterium]